MATGGFLFASLPYTGADAQVRGAVLTFTNITAFRASLGQAIYEREYTKTILNTVIDPLVVLGRQPASPDRQSRLLRLVRRFARASARYSAQVWATTIGRHPRYGLAESDAVGDREFETMELERDFPGIGRRIVLLDARRVVRDSGALVLLSFRDITDRKQAEQRCAKAKPDSARSSSRWTRATA